MYIRYSMKRVLAKYSVFETHLFTTRPHLNTNLGPNVLRKAAIELRDISLSDAYFRQRCLTFQLSAYHCADKVDNPQNGVLHQQKFSCYLQRCLERKSKNLAILSAAPVKTAP